jgi:pyruvate,water dikinase
VKKPRKLSTDNSRRLFRAIGEKLAQLQVIESEEDVFYLTIDELRNLVHGIPNSLEHSKIAKLRRIEFDTYREEMDPPDRFISYGVSGVTFKKPSVMTNLDLLRSKVRVSDDPNLFYGVPCSPGVIEGIVRVVDKIEDAQDLDGDILVTYRTDPGWVPLFPSCTGLIIERGSLLSHSAVVARELGLPTIVGVNGGIIQSLKTGDRVQLNATDGEIRKLQ